MDGLPPLPKSLSGLLNFSRESLSRAEGALGLRAPNAGGAGNNGVAPSPQAPAVAQSSSAQVAGKPIPHPPTSSTVASAKPTTSPSPLAQQPPR